MRHREVRRVCRAYERQSGAIMRGSHFVGRIVGDPHDRGIGRRCGRAATAARLGGARRAPMRLLPERHADASQRVAPFAPAADERPDRCCDLVTYLPVRNLSADSRSDIGGVALMKRGIFLAITAAASGAVTLGLPLSSAPSNAFDPSMWLSIDEQGVVTITIPMAEMGQGVNTALAMALVDELDAVWSQVHVETAVADKSRYGDQGIGGSRSMRKRTLPFRQAGATARQMLAEAAAARWGVSVVTCRTSDGCVWHDGTERRALYGSLVADAARRPLPADPKLKTRSEFRLIGKPQSLIEAEIKSSGKAMYGIDVRRPGMFYASIERAPRLGAELLSFDRNSAEAISGVRAIVVLDTPPFEDAFPFWRGLAVVADSYWSALKGRRALNARWSDGPNATVGSAQIFRTLQDDKNQDAFTAASIGDVGGAQKRSVKTIEATYYTPLQAHATMEPQNAVADVREGSCEVWLGTQSPTAVQEAAAKITRLPNAAVVVHQMLVGGGFGRRSDIDPAIEALMLSKCVGRPVKVVWTREDDITHDMYRPPHVSSLRAEVDEQKNLLAVVHRHTGPTIGIQRGYAKRAEADLEALDGIVEPEYAFPAYRAEFKLVEGVPVYFGWWRAVSEGQNRFAQECFIDEIARFRNVDPYEYRRTLLAHNPRALRVLECVASRARWQTKLSGGIGRGIAFAPYGKTLVAQVAEVSLTSARRVTVRRVVCAIDCGLIINPRTVEAQVQGGIVWGLGAALKHEITIAKGTVEQSNFDSYPMVRIDDMPVIEIELLESDADPSGVGEASVPGIAPAIANAIFALTGTRVRRLPIGAIP